MKTQLYKYIILLLLVFLFSGRAMAYTFDWKGNSSTAWTTSGNWTRSGSGGTSTYPGQSGSADIVRIGVNTFTGNQPTLSASVSIASLEFGDNGGNAITLTVANNITLTVVGTVLQDHNAANGGITVTISGTGTAKLTCTALKVGDNTAPPNPNGDYLFGGNLPSMNTTTFICNIPTLTVNGDITLNSTSSALTQWSVFFVGWAKNYSVNNPIFKLNSGTLTVNNIITTNSAYVNRNDGTFTIYNTATFQMDVSTSTNTLILLDNTPLSAATGGSFDFVNGGTVSASTVNYAATSGTQTVYNSTDPLNGSPTVYPNLTLSGASAKTVDGGSLTIGGDFTTGGGTVSLSTNNPSVAISGDWNNSTTVNEGTGTVTVGGDLTINSGATINGSTSSANTTVTGALTNSGSMLTNAENITVGSTAINNFVYTAASGNSTFNGTFTNNGSSSAFTAGSGTTTFNSTYTNTSGTFTAGSGDVYFNNNYTNSAGSTFTAGAGTVYFNRAGNQTLTDNSTAGTTFNNVNMQNSGTKTLAGTGGFNVSSIGTLTMAGSASLTTAGLLTLKSAANGTACIATIPAGTSISGNVTAERYLQGGAGYRSYRLLSSPVYVAAVSGVNVYSINYLKNSIYLTGTATGNGFDNTAAANPTLYLYRENLSPTFTTFLGSNFIGIKKINNATSYAYSMNDATYTSTYNIPVGSGYLCFFRGDRSTSFVSKTTGPYPVPENTTLSTTGTLNTGTITMRNWFNPGTTNLSYTAATPASYRGFNLVGNPYPSTIDWETYQSTNTGVGVYGKSISSTIYILNPKTQNFDTYQKGGGYTNYGTRYVESGQGFFVLASGTTSSVTFYETAKVSSHNTGLYLFMGKPADITTNNQYLRLQLAADSINTDDMLIRFSDSATTTYSAEADAPYKVGFGAVSICSLSSDQVSLAINEQPLPKTSERIALGINTKTDGAYSLNMKDIKGIPQLFDIWLIDNYKKDSVNMRQVANYNFNVVKSDTNSFGNNRFALVIRQDEAYAYKLLDFTASKSTGARQVEVDWKTVNEQNYTHFTVERSTDGGQTYEVIGGLTGNDQGTYSLVDKYPAAKNLYRLKSEDYNNAITYSKVVPVAYSNLSDNLVKSNINLYPNPTKSTINLSIVHAENTTATYSILITNSSGLLIKQAVSAQPSWQASVSDLMPGTYIVKVFNSKDQSFVGNTKFVKL